MPEEAVLYRELPSLEVEFTNTAITGLFANI